MFDPLGIQQDVQTIWNEIYGEGFEINEVDVDPLAIGEIKNLVGRYEVGMNIFYKIAGTYENIFAVMTYDKLEGEPINVQYLAVPHDVD